MVSSSWQSLKEQAAESFKAHNFELALELYDASLQEAKSINASNLDQQTLLSNKVACRLSLLNTIPLSAETAERRQHILEQALVEALDCVALNPSWSRGHMRAAKVYSLLGRSNDAAQSLQKVLTIDPRNAEARTMLLAELRRNSNNNNNNNNQSAEPNSNSTTANTSSNLEQELHWYEKFVIRFWAFVANVKRTYSMQNESAKTIIHILLGLLLLYVAFGGRFGIGDSSSRRHYSGNYGQNNAYQNVRDYDSFERESYRNNHRYYEGDSYHHRYSSGRGAGDTYYNTYQNNNNYSSNSWDLFDGSFQSIGVLLILMYGAYRAGINPFQALWAMNMLMGNRRGRAGFGGVFHMGGFGRGFGGGFGRRPYRGGRFRF